MVYSNQNQLVADLTRDIVAQTAPQELPLFRTVSAAYFKNPDHVLKGQSGKDDMLGFGVAETVIMLTPSILAIMTQVVNFVMAEVQKSVATNSADVINDLVSKMFKKFRPAEKADQGSPPALTTEQLKRVRDIAYQEAHKLALPEAQADILADSIVGSLVVAHS
ncbi:MAG: hypothetical protein NVS2B12_24520 [Ktedonobacteraceae bacterium]